MSALRGVLGARVPIQQAGFGSSLNVELVAAVAGAGGIGMVGGALAASADEVLPAGEIVRRFAAEAARLLAAVPVDASGVS